ncbi:MFS transporter [Xylona heveae TC161]|uniref:MFS transporter n=1 Tax=Xylona heveae (strain CBS 132557 / TC161) TaxID=1328760 RepID=A0A165AAD0_XYLHT|nr:MFS transporter [Xylona heveae TC161]KZF20167.1 MFS transporter [Xylona heveae TC161]
MERHENEPQPDPNLIDWSSPSDPDNPMNFSRLRKWIITVFMGIMAICATFASSVFSVATDATAKEFHVSPEVTTLGTSLFVLGFSFGPIFWDPFSELFGRKTPLFIGFFCFSIFQIPVAVAQNLETIMICRFWGGCFGAAPLAVVGGALADIWNPIDRTMAICIFGGGTFIGPVGAPIMGGFITQSHLGWRWTAWITLIMNAFFGMLAFIIVPETHGPTILQRRAKKVRHETHNWAIHAAKDEAPLHLKTITTVYLLRPFYLLIREPILLLVTLYLSFIYGILYLFLEAYPVSFQEQRGWNLGVGSLPFISIIVGVGLGSAVMIVSTRTRFRRKYIQSGNKVIPEERLPPMILGAMALPIGLFWFAWTSSPKMTWVPQVLAGVPAGMGIYVGFWQGLNYIVDCYGPYANSAIAANTFVRSLAGAGFPMFAVAMYHTLGVDWATTLLALLCIAFIPAPILLFVYGHKVRGWSRFTG